MLDNDADAAAAGSVRDLDPVPAQRGLGGEVDGDGGHGVPGGVAVQLRHQQVVVLHPQRELLHVDVVDGAVGGAEQEEGAGGVVRSDGGELLHLPVVGEAVPHADPAGGRERHQLRPDEEQLIHGDLEAEEADLGPGPVLAVAQQADAAAGGHGQQQTDLLEPRPRQHGADLAVDGHEADVLLEVGRGEAQLEPGALPQSVHGHEVSVGYSQAAANICLIAIGTFCLFQYRSHKTRLFENFRGFIPKMM